MPYAHRLRLLHFFVFGTLGALLPYFGLILSRAGLSAWEISLLSIVAPVTKLWLPPLLGLIADTLTGRKWILRFCTTASIGLWWLYFLPSDFAGWFLVFLYMALTRSPVIALANAATLDFLDNRTPHRTTGESFGSLRLFGSIGFIVAAGGAGLASTLFGTDAIIHTMGVLLVGLAVVSFTVDKYHLPVRRQQDSTDKSATQVLQHLFANQKFMMVLLTVLLVRSAEGAYNVFYTVHISHIGYSDAVAGLFWALAVLSEVFVLFYFGPRIHNSSPSKLFLMAAALNCVRWLLLATSSHFAVLVLAQIMHGITFGLFYITAIELMTACTPAQYKSTVQGLFDMIGFGLAGILGQLVAGGLYLSGDGTTMYLAAALMALVGTVVAWGVGRQRAAA